MKNYVKIAAIACGLAAGSGAAQAAVINFGESGQGYQVYVGNTVYNGLYYGQGAYADPGNNVWNGFGRYAGPGSTAFYGTDHANSNVNSLVVPAGNPGNPYAFSNAGTASGTNLFSPTNYGASNVGNANSNGTISPVTLTVGGITGENGTGTPARQGTAAFLLGTAALVSGTNVGTFTLANVPAGTYALYLYGANFDGTRGATFTASSGTAVGGITTTTNPNANGGGPLTSFVLGQNYVQFVGVTPVNGVISGTWSSVSNPISGLSGEGNFNGLQLVSIAAVPEPTSIGFAAVGAAGLLARRRRQTGG